MDVLAACLRVDSCFTLDGQVTRGRRRFDGAALVSRHYSTAALVKNKRAAAVEQQGHFASFDGGLWELLGLVPWVPQTIPHSTG